MNCLWNKRERYEKIIELICNYKGIKREEILKILKDKECKYLFYLLINKYQCVDTELLKEDFEKINKRNMRESLKRAEEKMLLDKRIREMFFEAEKIMDNIK